MAEGFRVAQAYDGPAAVAAFAAHEPDLVVLDVMLPGFDGLEVCRRIQAMRPVPVLMLTARDGETDLLVGLGVGADDYVTKPFSMREVVARIRALLRRVERAAELAASRPAHLDVQGLRIDVASRRVAVGDSRGPPHAPGVRPALRLGGRARRRPVARRPMREVWGWSDASGTRTLDSHVKALRAKIGADRVRTVHGVGYALEAGR